MERGEKRLARKLAKALKSIGKQLARDVSRGFGRLAEKLAKAEEEDERDLVDRAVDDVDWEPVARPVQMELQLVARDGAQRTLALLQIDESDAILEQTFTSAVDWASERSAELVGKSWNEDGELIDNPNAEMAISDTVRESIRKSVATALEDGDSAAELGDTIEELGEFSADRAMLIARTEIIRAHAQGQMAAMRGSGVVDRKAWSTAEDGDTCEECEGNADDGDIDLEDDFSSGDDAPPAHPACRCTVVAVIGEEDEDEEGDDEESDEDDSDDEEDVA